jgi:hypothetical protein
VRLREEGPGRGGAGPRPSTERPGRRGKKQRRGIGHCKEEERGGADRWGRAASEREERVRLGLRDRGWAGVAVGPRGEERGEGRPKSFGLLSFLSFFFSFSFPYSNYSNKPYTLNTNKQCSSMNAQTS